MKRNAFSLIEIIFTIVVISITILTLPILIKKSENSIKDLKKSLYFSNGNTELQIIINKVWDENNIPEYLTSSKYTTLTTDSVTQNNASLDCISNYRLGHYSTSNRRKCTTSNLLASTIQLDAGESIELMNFDDIDDFHNSEQRILNFEQISTSIITEIDNQTGSTGDITVIRNYINQILSEQLDGVATITIATLATKYSLLESTINTLMNVLSYLKIEAKIEYINYKRTEVITGVDLNITIDTTSLTTLGKTSDIKKITIILTDLVEEEIMEYYYYSTNIGTDPIVKKVN